MTTEALIEAVLEREGGYVDDPADTGGATHYGITARTLGEWRHLGRNASRPEVKALTRDEARAIYRAQYVRPFAAVPFPELQASLVDFAVHSGVVTAIKALQKVLGVTVDGIYGDRTKMAVSITPWRLVNSALIAERIRLQTEDIRRHPDKKKFLWGWLQRDVSLLV